MIERKCRACEGTGALRESTVSQKPCPTCGGLGIVSPDKFAMCYSIHETSGELIRIQEGMLGAFYMRHPETHKPYKDEAAEDLRDILNTRLGISREEELMLLGGSMFGWHLPGVRAEIRNINRISRTDCAITEGVVSC